MYIWERPDWPGWRWASGRLAPPLEAAHLKQGRFLARMERLGFPFRGEAELQAVTEEAVKNAEIEGERLDRASVRSSVARRLGLPDAALAAEDRRVEGMVDMTLDATQNLDWPITRERLWAWQAGLFPSGRSGLSDITVGGWRTDRFGPMEVVSGPIARPRVHYQAPPANRVEIEMQAFLGWLDMPVDVDSIIHAALAHLWFVTIHPFEDGNGRIARVLADRSLARAEQSAHRFYSLSGQIRRERAGYYMSLERTQRGDFDITEHLLWFIQSFTKALVEAERTSEAVLQKAEFWHIHALDVFNERQRMILNRFLDGFEGKLTAPKWAAMAKCSLPTAQRDLKDLVDRAILVRNDGSKNTSYDLRSSI